MTPLDQRARQEGRKAMESSLTPAAQVRRRFRVGLGRPRKPEQLPLHPVVVWQRATEAANKFREAMSDAGLPPDHVSAEIVYTEAAHPLRPMFLHMQSPTKSFEELRRDLLDTLGREGVIAPGLVFRQYDEQLQKEAYFPYPLAGLDEQQKALMQMATLVVQETVRVQQQKN